ncbi:MAG: BsuPI-related putative proteinase inhibitor [Steroidobacteraceae bacterium]
MMNLTGLGGLRPHVRLLPILAACAMCLGATSQSCKLGRQARDQNDFSDFSVELQLQNDAGAIQDTFDQQDHVHFVLNVTNGKDEKATLTFSSTQQADFAIVTDDRAERVLWVASQNSTAQTTPTEVEFSAGETKTFTFDGVLIDADGEFLPRGDYQAVGALLVDFDNFATDPLADNDLASDPVPLTID